MSEIRKLSQEDHELVKKYIYKQFWPCIELAKVFDKNGLNNIKMNKNSGDFFGYFEDELLEGLFLFTNNKRFLLHFTNSNVTKKVDLLKAIRFYKPEFMSGVSENVSLIWKMFERTVKRYKYNNSMYMVLDTHNPINDLIEYEGLLREATIADAKKQVNFLIQLERHFGRSHMTINQLQQRIVDRHGKHEYFVIEKDEKVVAQGFVEDKINAFSQIGGIYTVPSNRGNRLGEVIVRSLSKTIIESGNIPILAVLKDNEPAVRLYERLHFKAVADFSIIEIEF